MNALLCVQRLERGENLEQLAEEMGRGDLEHRDRVGSLPDSAKIKVCSLATHWPRATRCLVRSSESESESVGHEAVWFADLLVPEHRGPRALRPGVPRLEGGGRVGRPLVQGRLPRRAAQVPCPLLSSSPVHPTRVRRARIGGSVSHAHLSRRL